MKWNVVEKNPSALQRQYGLSSLAAKALMLSECSEEQIAELLNEDFRMTLSKADCVQKACERIVQARNRGEKVFVAGDYDADGICSTAIMKKTLDVLHIENGYYIPDRLKEGYGLKPETVEKAHEKGYSLIITVDNGVRAHEAIAKAKELGMDIIVTDHHEMVEEIHADLVVHPAFMEDCFSYFSGAGVALEISWNLIGEDSTLIALAAVAAIGDVMPLWKETRKLVNAGIQILNRGGCLPIRALFPYGDDVTADSIAFQAVPRLNALGRMSDLCNVNTAVKYLLSKNPADIQKYAAQMNTVNDARKKLSAYEVSLAEKMETSENFGLYCSEEFHEGICGLVAGKMADSLKKPVLVLAEKENELKGSGRSAPGFDLFRFLSDFDGFTAYGGHEMAVGVSLKKERYEDLKSFIEKGMAESGFAYEEPVKSAVKVSMDEIDFDSIVSLDRLRPFPKEMTPYFAVEDFEVKDRIETPKTVKYILTDGKKDVTALVYKSRGIDCPDDIVRVIGKLSINRYRGRVTLNMEVEDLL